MKNLVFDTETTGLPKHPKAKDEFQPRIIEWGGMIVDENGAVLRELNIIINPGIPLEAIITKITGLTDEDLKDKPSFPEVMGEIRSMFAEADTVIAHNLPFDSTLMNLELARAGVTDWPWPKIQICTVQEHAEEWGRRPKLLELFEHYTGNPLDQTHRALDDVRALVTVAKAAGVLV